MDLSVVVEGEDEDDRDLVDLRDWILSEHIDGVTRVQSVGAPAKPGEMGLDPATLQVILSTPAVAGLVASLHTWIKTRRKKVTVSIKTGKNEVLITSENLDPADLEALLKASGS